MMLGRRIMLAFLWRKWTSSKRRPRGNHVTPRFEVLEDRCLLATALAEFPLLTSGGSPFAITTGPDGNVWYTENQAGKIGMINPTTHAQSEFLIPTASSGPTGITAGPDGNLWFAESGAKKIGMPNPTT